MTVQRFGCLWTEEQIVEIVTVSAMFGFLNRWNDTLATPLEDNLLEFAEKHLAAQGWEARQAPTVASLRPALWVTLTPKK